MWAIETVGLRKVYAEKVALADLSLQVAPGEIFGFLGANGAGKTTTIKILTGLVRASAGQALIFGQDAQQPAARRRIGYLPELFRFPDWLSGAAVVALHAELAGVPTRDHRARVEAALARVGLSGRGQDRVRTYSKGMQQRLGLAQALVGQPDVVLLDEPTSALDPLGRRDVRDLMRELRDEGVTVFLNSHLLSEVELVCDRVAIVDRGRVVAVGPPADLADAPEVRVTVDRVEPTLIAALGRYGRILDIEGTTVTLAATADTAADIAEAVMVAGFRLYGLTPSQRSLEEIFVGLVQNEGA